MSSPIRVPSFRPVIAGGLCIVGSAAVWLAHTGRYANGISGGLTHLAGWAVFVLATLLGLVVLTMWAVPRATAGRWRVAVLVLTGIAVLPTATWVLYWWWPTPRSIVRSIRSHDDGELRKAIWLRADLDRPEEYDMGFGGHVVGDTPVTAAIRARDASALRSLLGHSAAPSAKDGHGTPPLAVAAQVGDPATIALLLQAGATVDATDADGRTALYWAAGLWHPSVVQQLLSAGASTALADSLDKQSPLHVAVVGHVHPYEGNAPDPDPTHRLRCIQLLRGAGAAVDVPDERGQTPVALAVTAGDAAAVAILTAPSATRTAPPDDLAVAMGRRNDDAAIAILDRSPRDLLEIQASPYRGSSLLVAALKTRMPRLARYLLDRHVLVTDIAIRTAVGAGDPTAIESLVTESNSSGHRRWGRAVTWEYVLSVAAYKGQLPVARLAVNQGASVRAEVAGILPNVRLTPLHSAAAGGNVDLMSFLAGAGADVNAHDEGDFRSPSVMPGTPLDVAIIWAEAPLKHDAIQWLLRHGAFANNQLVADKEMTAAGIDANGYYAALAARRRAWAATAKVTH